MTGLMALLQGLVAVLPPQDCEVTALALDTREVVPGALFFALAGSKSHGRHFIAQAVNAGAIAVLIELEDASLLTAEERGLLDAAQVFWLCVADLKQRLGEIAERFYGNPSQAMTVIGVTGTNGKTSCSQFIAQALNQIAPCAVIGTLGNGLVGALQPATHTTPDAIKLHRELARMRSEGATAVAMEVSSHGLDQGRVAGVRFDTAVFTNLTRDHLDYHGTMENYGAAKRRLFHASGLRHAVVNLDDRFGVDVLNSLAADVQGVGYGLSELAVSQGTAVIGRELVLSDQGLMMDVCYRDEQARLVSPLLGRFNASNLLAALAVLVTHGVGLARAAHLLNECAPVPGRMEAYGGGELPLVVVDYAHTPDALEKVLSTLRDHCAGQLGCVFGCGGNRDAGKRPLMGEMAARLADWVVVTDDNPRHEDGEGIIADILQGTIPHQQFEGQVQVVRDRAVAIRQAIERASSGDLVLIAGKGHENYQIVGETYTRFSDSEQVMKSLSR